MKKLSIDIPDELYQRVESLSAMLGLSIQEFVMDAIDDQIDFALVEEVRKQLATGQESLVDWEEVKGNLLN